MIKKNTKIIFEDDKERVEDLKGGIPLSKGDIIHMHKDGGIIDYKVIDKKIDYYIEDEDQIVNIVYVLKKIN